LEITEDEVLEALEAGQARSATGLEAPLGGDETAATLAQTLGSTDPAYAIIDDRDIVHDALASLDDRAARVVRLRYLEDMSQPEIAERIGVSQSYVSRILRTSLESLRTELSPR
jgi:RNA polymerase sigma-B factor